MPELPEVEAVCRKLRVEAARRTLVRMRIERANMVKPHPPPVLCQLVEGRQVESVERRGKNILLGLSGMGLLHVHLGMTGNLFVIPDVRFRCLSARIWFELDDGKGLIFEDPRTLGRLRFYHRQEASGLLAELGVEPLSDQFTLSRFVELARSSRQPAKIFLMDQRRIAGLGNIYAAEALFRARMDPRKSLSRVSRKKLAALHQAIVEVLNQAVECAVKAYAKPGVFQEAEEFPCQVYAREGKPCLRCGHSIRRIHQGGRSTYFCPACQR
ncbi:MAG: bifunctional DNA-formamidopyrimidine glycosylase/DNA-(apurinic or apyrimidinic site) lyase [Bryobacteraceae bacterium]|nr:bifunctional DNA-formamidopyrimidine glycosylase/DNA-(apurinic or apyrimidinic site) lyase [Bryobacteraceae bacterium]MDW8376523.1 bifunctional DNA-formamidopyrimidine glycosylase/DNA-(apurinic or apyrimidinic site) lyase [Bryobacterales bacterium]